MKNVAKTLIVISLILKSVLITLAQNEVPKKLQGFWKFSNTEKDAWDGINIGKNYFEIMYFLTDVDSIRQSNNDYIFHLSYRKRSAPPLTFKLFSKDSALFSFPEAKMEFKCKHYDRSPDINYINEQNYSKIIDGKWFSDVNIDSPLMFENSKLRYDGKLWNVVWFGEYMKREYRALIENEGKYRLIYLVRENKDQLRLTIDQKSTIYKPILNDPSKYAIFGNWVEPVKNEWTYGFYDQFAVYNSRFWDYKTLNIKNNEGIVTLQNGNDTLHLNIKKTNKTLFVTQENGKTIAYQKATRVLPHYQMADTTRFADNHFARIDTAYITGYLPNRTVKRPFEILIHDIILDKDIPYYSEVDSLNRFEMKVPLYNSTMVFFDWKQYHLSEVLEPNEHYFYLYDANDNQILFMGKNVRIQNELAAFDFDIFNYFSLSRNQEIRPLDLLDKMKEDYSNINAALNNIFDKMPNPSTKLRTFCENFNKYNIASTLLQNQYYLDRNNNEKFPDEYVAYLKDTLLKKPPVPITINRDFFDFTRDYIQYFKSTSDIVRGDIAFIELVKKNKIQLTDAEKDIVISCNDYFMSLKDTIGVREYYNKHKAKFDKNKEIFNKNIDKISTEIDYLYYEKVLTENFNVVDSMKFEPTIGDVLKARILYKNIFNNQKPLYKDTYEKCVSQINTPLLKNKIKEFQDYYTEMSGRSIEHEISLKNTDHLKESKDADALWNELIAPYKGKIIYVDFWGTWCGPCKMEMGYVADLKKQFIGKDVIFMYFANNSPKESWENVIKMSSLTGENVVHYRLSDEQERLIEHRFGVVHYPTFMLIDRNGMVVDNEPPRPSTERILIDYLNSWLEKK